MVEHSLQQTLDLLEGLLVLWRIFRFAADVYTTMGALLRNRAFMVKLVKDQQRACLGSCISGNPPKHGSRVGAGAGL